MTLKAMVALEVAILDLVQAEIDAAESTWLLNNALYEYGQHFVLHRLKNIRKQLVIAVLILLFLIITMIAGG